MARLAWLSWCLALPALAQPHPPACGGFESLPTTAALPLLADRLRMQPLRGMHDEPRAHDIMAADAPPADETRLILDDHGRRMVVFAVELWATAPADLGTAARTTVADLLSVEPTELDPVTLAAGNLRIAAFRPHALATDREGVPVLGVLVAPPDRHAIALGFFVTPDVAAPGCIELASRLASTLAAGPRVLDLAARDVTLSSAVRAHLPTGWSFSTEHGPDFEVHRIRRIDPIGARETMVGMYVGNHPHAPVASGRTAAGRLYGRPVQWILRSEGGQEHAEVLVELSPGGLSTHVWLLAPDPQSLAAARAIAEGFTLVTR